MGDSPGREPAPRAAVGLRLAEMGARWRIPPFSPCSGLRRRVRGFRFSVRLARASHRRRCRARSSAGTAHSFEKRCLRGACRAAACPDVRRTSRFRRTLGCSNPAMRRRRVVFPEPLSPSNVRNSPAAMFNEIFFRTSRAPKRLATARTSSSGALASTEAGCGMAAELTARLSPHSRFRCTCHGAAHPAKNRFAACRRRDRPGAGFSFRCRS